MYLIYICFCSIPAPLFSALTLLVGQQKSIHYYKWGGTDILPLKFLVEFCPTKGL